MKKILGCVLAGTLLFSVAGCDLAQGGGNLLEQSEYTIELGEQFAASPSEQCDVVVLDAKGKEVRNRYGAFKPAVGEYEVTYTSKKSSKKQTVKVVCKDTTAPTVSFETYVPDVTVGDVVSVPRYQITDLSAVKSQSMKVLDPTGAEVTLGENNSWTMTAGTYTVVVNAEDAVGNKVETKAIYTAREVWIDETLEAGVLFDFDEQDYLNLVYGIPEQECFTPSIVTEGYPEIEDEKEGNGVLQLTTDYDYGETYAKFATYAPMIANKATTITIRVAVDRDIEWVKVTREYGGNVGGVQHRVKAGKWYDLVIDPIDYGYTNAFADFLLYARADYGLTVWVDEISYEERWVDVDRAENVIADFDEEGYVQSMYQNVYSGVAYASGAGGSSFSVVDYPNDTTRKVMKIETTATKGGFTYMFDEPIETANIESITIMIDVVYPCKNIWMNFLKSDYRCSSAAGIQDWYSTTDYPDGPPWTGKFDNKGAIDELRPLVVPSNEVKKLDTVITGLFIGIIDSTRVGNVMYIDEVVIQYSTVQE